MVLGLLVEHHLLEVLKLFCLFLQLLVFLNINLLFQIDHLPLEGLKLLTVLVSDPLRRLHLRLELRDGDVLLAELQGKLVCRRLFYFLTQGLVLLLLLLHKRLIFTEFLLDAFFVMLELLAFFFEFHFDLKELFFLLGDLAGSFLDFEFQLLLKLDNPVFPLLEVGSLGAQLRFLRLHFSDSLVELLVTCGFLGSPVACDLLNRVDLLLF